MDPILIEFGPIVIRYYGLMYLTAAVVGVWLLGKEVRRKSIPMSDDDRWNFVMFCMLGGILGGRIYYVAFNWGFYGQNLKEIPAIWHGGLAIHGGLIGAFIAAALFLRGRGIPFLKMADASAPMIILGQAFGRFGNFMNGDAHGYPTDKPWGVVFPPGSIAAREFGQVPTHPVMLYELFLNFSVFLFLWSIRKTPRGDGWIFSLYLILYSVIRFFVTIFRADDLYIGALRAPQVVSVIIIVVMTAFIVKRRLWLPPPGTPR